ncbi:MAG TPA: ABC transporter permease [Thermoanaerobaculia bacterium]|jgi:predicted permease
MSLVLQLRHAVRRLWNSPELSLLCLLTLAVGIGSVVTVFSVVNGVLLDPLPYPESARLVGLWHMAPGLNLRSMPQSQGTYLLYSQQGHGLADMAIYRELAVNLTGGETPERVRGVETTPSLFRLLGVAPGLGRGLTPEEGHPGAPAVVVLSDQLWRRSFGADPGILGKTVRINGVGREVVGVMPPGFDFPRPRIELWVPLAVDPLRAPLGDLTYTGVGRLVPGVSIAQAQSDLNRALVGLERRFPGDDAAPVLSKAGLAAVVHPLRDDIVGDFGKALWILLGAVGFVLLIACANVANLLIIRGEGRRREMAIQTSLGATRSFLIGGGLAESLLLALAAGAVGLLLAFGGLHLLRVLGPAELPRLEKVRLDSRVLLFTATLSLLTTGLFGLLPALRSSLIGDLATELKSGGGRTATSGRSRRRARQLLVGAQIALAIILLTGSGLMLRSFLRLVSLNPGFQVRQVLTFQVALPEAQYPDDAAAARFFQQAIDRLRAVPGITAAAVTSSLPLGGSTSSTGHEIEGQPVAAGAPPPVLGVERVSAGYFQALGARLIEGRSLEPQDEERRTGAVVVNEAAAKRFWPGQSALGKRLRPSDSGLPLGSWYNVVGVAGDIRNRRLTDEPEPLVYYSLLGKTAGAWVPRQMSFVLRTGLKPESMATLARREIWAIDPNLPLSNISTMETLLQKDQARLSFSVWMFLIAAAVAMILGAVGIYGFISYLVTQRAPEIGVRMAIGAERRSILWMILRESLGIFLVGLAIGIAGALGMTRWLESFLFEVSPFDPLTFALVPLLLLAVVLLASYLPAERATRIDPLEALQSSE